LTVTPVLILEIGWLFLGPTRAGFDITCLAGYIIQHILELLFCWPVYRSFKYYQDGFYQFARGMSIRNNQLELLADDDGTV
jgi:hypothetical protein